VNLVENAIRRTPAGGTVRVTVTATARDLTVSVEDTGHGIPDADRERIFDRFVRLSPADSPPSTICFRSTARSRPRRSRRGSFRLRSHEG
jgi:signal transduction histidine kinase